MGLLLPHYKHLNLTSLPNGCVTYTRERVHVNCVAVTCSRTAPKLTELPSITYRYDLIASIKKCWIHFTGNTTTMHLQHGCQTLACGPNLARSVTEFNTKSLLELAVRYNPSHVLLILQNVFEFDAPGLQYLMV